MESCWAARMHSTPLAGSKVRNQGRSRASSRCNSGQQSVWRWERRVLYFVDGILRHTERQGHGCDGQRAKFLWVFDGAIERGESNVASLYVVIKQPQYGQDPGETNSRNRRGTLLAGWCTKCCRAAAPISPTTYPAYLSTRLASGRCTRKVNPKSHGRHLAGG